MTGHGEKLSRKQEEAIAALISEPTITAAAEAVKVGDATLWRWLQLPEFQEAYRQARREVVSQAIARLQGVTGDAVKALHDIIKNNDAPTSSRVAAARAILDFSIKAVELDDMESRIAALEKIVSEGGIPK